MTTNNIFKCLITLALLGGVMAGCKSSSKNPVPTNDASVPDAGTPNAGSGGSGGSAGNSGTGGSGGSAGSSGTGGTGGMDMDGSVPDDTGTPLPSCTDSTHNNCFSCAPKTDVEFFNQCITGFTCNHYDNGPLGLTNGKLPAL